MGKEFHLPNTLAELFLWPGTAAASMYGYIRQAFVEHIRRKDGCRGARGPQSRALGPASLIAMAMTGFHSRLQSCRKLPTVR